ncbi:TetR family transcriptional regulator [Streptomyces triticagri]|uniref:TetR family transcriptional regulator n=1 Tax=Streptomyces triticagri TaxID=2293568 RepID=A0A372M4E9_9ACTN|nr:TetR/AcrR family transcriptional regulator [Streptomyces triticagri]RFU85816.1 TetR family transcriptional regulator [Streptomyces triticagri]
MAQDVRGAEGGPAAAPRRRDARRNRERLVAAAREIFGSEGLEAPLDLIARRAVVGNATLYRHFPDRAALIGAVFEDSLAGVTAAGEEARANPDVWSGLTGYLDAVFAVLAGDRGTNDLMTTRLQGIEALDAIHVHNAATLDELLGRGRRDGVVRDDVTTEDVLFTLAALGRAVPALTAAAGPDAWRRPLALVLAGLGPGAPGLPGAPLSASELTDTLAGLGPHRPASSAGGSTGARSPSGTNSSASGTNSRPSGGPTRTKSGGV